MHLEKQSEDVTERNSMADRTSVCTVAPAWVFRPVIPKTHKLNL